MSESGTFTSEMHRIFDSAADVYDQSGVPFFQPIGRRLVEVADVSAGESVLDVACGRGAVLVPAAERVGASGRALGVDVSESMLAHAGRAARERGMEHVETQQMDAQRPALSPGQFDAVLSSCGAILWIRGTDDVRPYRELLHPGGRFALSGPSFFVVGDGRIPFLPEPVADLLRPEVMRLAESVDMGDNPFVNPDSSWLSDRERVRSSLVEAGFAAVEIHEEDLPIVVESGRQWVDWTMSHGMRAMWERIPEPRASDLATEIASRLDEERDSDGQIRLSAPIVYILARVAGA